MHPRHPYVGELVYTAFSGSHQDAIKKGMDAQERSRSDVWDVPYLPIDPMDVGRTYEAIIRVNSQSGKGGVAYLMETEHHLELPRGLQVDFAQKVQAITDARGDELTADELLAIFREHYLAHERPYELVSLRALERRGATGSPSRLLVDGEEQEVEGVGNGPIAALVDAFERRSGSRSGSATTTSTRWPRAPTPPPPPTSRPTSTTRSSGASASTRASSRRRCGRSSTRSTARSRARGAGGGDGGVRCASSPEALRGGSLRQETLPCVRR